MLKPQPLENASLRIICINENDNDINKALSSVHSETRFVTKYGYKAKYKIIKKQNEVNKYTNKEMFKML